MDVSKVSNGPASKVDGFEFYPGWGPEHCTIVTKRLRAGWTVWLKPEFIDSELQKIIAKRLGWRKSLGPPVVFEGGGSDSCCASRSTIYNLRDGRTLKFWNSRDEWTMNAEIQEYEVS